MSGRVVVVGGGLAAGTLVTQLREGGHDGSITLFTDEPRAPYERPPLSKDLLLGKGTEDKAFVHEESWYAENDVDLHPTPPSPRSTWPPVRSSPGPTGRRTTTSCSPPARDHGTSGWPTRAARRSSTCARWRTRAASRPR